MIANRVTNKKILIFYVVLISLGLDHSVFAQEIGTNTNSDKTSIESRITEFDHLLNIGISAPLTALSLTGATFLTRTPSANEDPTYTRLMNDAKKSLIKAFVIFLACTIALFVFDFIELLLSYSIFVVGLIDLVITYSLLFAGFGNLAIAAKKMYRTQVKHGW